MKATSKRTAKVSTKDTKGTKGMKTNRTAKTAAAMKTGNVGAKTAELVVVEHKDIDLGLIDKSPFQTRMDFSPEGLHEMAQSLVNQGQIEPIVVRRVVEGRYELLVGHRRTKAATLAGLTSLRAEIVEASDAQAAEIVLAENIHRKDLTAIEEGAAYQAMIDLGMAKGATEIGERLGIAQSTVSNRMRLLRLPEWWRRLLIDRHIGERHARAVLAYVEFPAIMAALEKRREFRIGKVRSAASWWTRRGRWAERSTIRAVAPWTCSKPRKSKRRPWG
jgi:ParB/RepB/Spo0J family partition protein